jgi:hypothetical protein
MTQEIDLLSNTRKPYLQQRCVNLIVDINESYRQKANFSATILEVKNDFIKERAIRIPLEVRAADGESLQVLVSQPFTASLKGVNNDKAAVKNHL